MSQVNSRTGGIPVIEAKVKWFNTAKGFGFVAPVDGSPDVFLHMAVLEAAGLPAPAEGATIMCEIGAGKKGPQVSRVVEMSGAEARPAPRGGSMRPTGGDLPDEPGAVEIACRVRWYCAVRGYGFLIPEDGTEDVFVNAKVLRRSDLIALDQDQNVTSMVVQTPKGREARAVRIV